MTVKEAYEKIINWQPEMKVMECYEYETIYTFQLAPISYEGDEPLFSGLFSVDKKTGNIRSFKPFDIPIEEYRDGKQITDYE